MGFETPQSLRSLVVGSLAEESNKSVHSVVVMEPTSQHSRMTELEAELEAELERMQFNLTAGISSHSRFSGGEMMDTDSMMDIVNDDQNASGDPGKNVFEWEKQDPDRNVHVPNYGVSPIELERRLHELLERRQEEHIEELKATLKSAENKLIMKEMELSWWKERAWQLSKLSLGSTGLPGDKSIGSMSTDVKSSKSSSVYGTYNQDDMIQGKNILKEAEPLNFYVNFAHGSVRMKYINQGSFDMEQNSRESFKDFKTILCSQNNRAFLSKNAFGHVDLASPSEKCLTDNLYSKGFVEGGGLEMDDAIQRDNHTTSRLEYNQHKGIPAPYGELQPSQTAQCNGFEKDEGTESKKVVPLYTRRKVACLENLHKHSSARNPQLNKNAPEDSDILHYGKRLETHPCLNTPSGNCKGKKNSQVTYSKVFQSMPENKACQLSEEGRGLRSPVLDKIRHWEALSRGESSARQSCDLGNQFLSPQTVNSLASGQSTVN
eukprot:Gb_14136 [translate_table: standard]